MSEKAQDNTERWETNGYNAAMFRQHSSERRLLIGGGSTKKKVNKLLLDSEEKHREIYHASELTSTLNLHSAHMAELRVSPPGTCFYPSTYSSPDISKLKLCFQLSHFHGHKSAA